MQLHRMFDMCVVFLLLVDFFLWFSTMSRLVQWPMDLRSQIGLCLCRNQTLFEIQLLDCLATINKAIIKWWAIGVASFGVDDIRGELDD